MQLLIFEKVSGVFLPDPIWHTIFNYEIRQPRERTAPADSWMAKQLVHIPTAM
jgi:hypothetical protein